MVAFLSAPPLVRGGAAPAFSLYLNGGVRGASSNLGASYNYSAIPVGEPREDRFIVFGVMGNQTSGSVGSATIGGIEATRVVGSAGNSGNGAIFFARIPTGNILTIVARFNVGQGATCMGYMVFVGKPTMTFINGSIHINNNFAYKTHSLGTQPGGIVFAVAHFGQSTITTSVTGSAYDVAQSSGGTPTILGGVGSALTRDASGATITQGPAYNTIGASFY